MKSINKLQVSLLTALPFCRWKSSQVSKSSLVNFGGLVVVVVVDVGGELGGTRDRADGSEQRAGGM